jgi:MoxR-like ATPase
VAERSAAGSLLAQVNGVFLGKEEVVRLALTCLLAGGHLLLEDVPGVGKTTLARALARSLGVRFSRIQFTSDLLPADILGVTVFNQKESTFEFKPGPIFANIVLADEINRTTPRTQSSLLEAMSEARVTIDDVTHVLPRPFLVIATQNPMEAHGTYPLPESQLDRFLMRLSIGYPDQEVEHRILTDRRRDEPVDALQPVMSGETLLALQSQVDEVHVDDSLVGYVMSVVEATRRTSRLRMGVSPRGGLHLLRAGRALALLRGRDHVTPEDIRQLAAPVLAHRISTSGLEGIVGNGQRVTESVVQELVSRIDVPV